MSTSAERSYWACVFSVQHLLRGPEGYTLQELADGAKPATAAYLWTFTFPDLETRLNAKECAARWDRFAKRLARDGWQMVRSLEAAPGSGFYHYHAVTGDRKSAKAVWGIVGKYGLGRPDVKLVPIDAALYVAKYIRKRIDLPKGMRRWACIGFKGATAAEIKITKKVLHLVPNCFDSLRDADLWDFGNNFTVLVKRRETPIGHAPQIHMITLKAAAQKEILDRVANGTVVAVGEYRGCTVTEKKMESWQTKRMETMVLVEHSIEFGAKAVSCSEWLPQGSTAKDVKSPANRGDVVLVEITKMSKFGYGVSSIKPVSTLV